jgi:subtilase family serine protease
MKFSLLMAGVAAVSLGVVGPASTHAFGAARTAPDLSRATDQGALVDLGAGEAPMTVTLPLNLRNLAGAEAMMIRVATPGDALYHQFLTPDQFRTAFGPDEAEVARAVSVLRLSGLSAERTTSTTLSVSGSVAAMQRVFQTELHQFNVPAGERSAAVTFQAPVVKPTVPEAIASVVQTVVGLDDVPAFTSNMMQAPSAFGGVPAQALPGNASTGTPFGVLTVTDFAKLYDVEPIYAKGVTGAGRTVAVVTLASFTPSDVFTYWADLGLKVNPDRISIVNVDGGPGAPSDASGSDETTLDVEQSGGIAPGADIIVYQAPNKTQSFLDDFAQAVEDNQADSISTSFGTWEFRDSAQNNRMVTDAFNGMTESALQGFHNVFVQAALQGQSVFAAAGDSGAFDTVRGFGDVNFTDPLSVDYPGSDSAISAAGGTTLPGTQILPTSATASIEITVATERVWGWDYLEPFCTAIGETLAECGIFSVGGGGGVSSFFDVPFYQKAFPGVQLSQPNQSFIQEDVTPPDDIFDLPANFAGRNVPDFVYNADPETGYEIVYTSNVNGFETLTFIGGTSFVAPQLNGVTALLGQNAHARFGLLNVPLYALARTGLTGLGPFPLIVPITTGDNWFYTGRNGFSPAGGLGKIQVNNLSEILR